jgi:hypothetical protein
MRNGKTKHPNAIKHGSFATTAILPGEDAAEFEELYSDLIAEWIPNGATEQDAVLSIAKAVWRKRRVQRFLTAQVVKHSGDPNHIWYDETVALTALAAFVREDPESAFSQAAPFLHPVRIVYFKEKVPRSRFGSTSEWAEAILKETDLLLALQHADPEGRRLVAMSKSADALSGDLFKQELALDERLDAMIDRAVKRLIQTKAMKQMLGQTSGDQSAGRQKRIESKTARK